jgi:hypothetical protein
MWLFACRADNKVMRLLRYVLVPWAAVLVYSFLTFFLGQDGLYARRHLESEHRRLSQNAYHLQSIADSYAQSRENLLTDGDAFSVHARQLGLGWDGEKFIRVMGLGVASGPDVFSGQAVYAVPAGFVPGLTIKIISMAFGFAVLVFFLIDDLYSLRAASHFRDERHSTGGRKKFPGRRDFSEEARFARESGL